GGHRLHRRGRIGVLGQIGARGRGLGVLLPAKQHVISVERALVGRRSLVPDDAGAQFEGEQRAVAGQFVALNQVALDLPVRRLADAGLVLKQPAVYMARNRMQRGGERRQRVECRLVGGGGVAMEAAGLGRGGGGLRRAEQPGAWADGSLGAGAAAARGAARPATTARIVLAAAAGGQPGGGG